MQYQQHRQSYNNGILEQQKLVQQHQQSQKLTPRATMALVPPSPDKYEPMKQVVNPNLNNIFAEMPLPATPKSKENNPRGANVYSGV